MNHAVEPGYNRGRTVLLDIASCLGFIVYAASMVSIPVSLLNMASEIGFNLAEGGLLEMARTFLLFAVLLIAGKATAYYGKQKMLTLGCILTALGMVSLSMSHTYVMAIISIMLIGFGSGLLEALISPIVQDLHPKNSNKALNIVNAFFPLGILISSFLVGYAITCGISWRFSFQIIALCSILVGLLFLTGNGISFPKPRANFKDVYNIMKHPRLYWLGLAIICAGAIEAAFTFWSASYVRLRFENVAILGAIATSIFAASMFIGRLVTGFLSSYIDLRKIIKISSIIGIGACIIIPFINSIIGFQISLAIAGLSTACLWPSILALSANEMRFDSTLIMIILSCFGILGTGLAGWIIGVIGNSMSLTVGLVTAPIFFMILLISLRFDCLCTNKVKFTDNFKSKGNPALSNETAT